MKLSSKLIEQIKPQTFYDELANYGLLLDYVKKFFKEKFENDESFKTEIFKVLVKYSKDPVDEINLYFLKQLSSSLTLFNEQARKWKNQTF